MNHLVSLYDTRNSLSGLYYALFHASLALLSTAEPDAKTISRGARVELQSLIFRLQGKMYPDMNCVGAWMEVPGSKFEQLVSAVKNRILDFVLRIEAENPNAGEAPPNTQPVPKEKLRPLVHNVFYGAVGTETDRDRGKPHGFSPATPPYVRVPYTAVRRVEPSISESRASRSKH